MRKGLAAKLEAEMRRHEEICLRLANERLDDFEREWKRTRKTTVTLFFGMGTMSADGAGLDKYAGRGWPQILTDLDDDLDELTNQYRTACPDNRTITS